MAVGHVRPGGAAASSAAPGVDHASTIGMRSFSDNAAPPTAKPRHNAVTAEPVCSTDAPSVPNACTTRAIVPPKPTTVAMRAEDQECSGGSCLGIAVDCQSSGPEKGPVIAHSPFVCWNWLNPARDPRSARARRADCAPWRR